MGKLTGSSSKSFETGAEANNAEEIVHRERASTAGTSALSSSMIMAVNNAAETARLVLDQVADENTIDDNRSVSSAHQSCGSVNSIHSRSNSRGGTGGNINKFGIDDLMFDDDLGTPQGDEKSDDEPQVDVAPPPNAFQNFPMSRGFVPFHKSTAAVTDVLTDGTEFHVTNHFDAAAAISAALASSHLADASGCVGKLQMPHTYPMRSDPTKPLSKSQSGGAAEYVRATIAGDGDQDTPVQRSRSSGLPTREEAEALMKSNRDSFMEDDMSVESYGDLNFVLRAMSGDQQTLSAENEQLSMNVENGNEKKRPIKTKVKSSHEISGDNISTSFENESNTSSVDGSNSDSGYSSDVSPISMSTGEDSGNKNQNGGNSTNKTGMLGNLARTRRALVQDSYAGRYEVEDDEYSTNSENSGLHEKHSSQRRIVYEDAKKSKVTMPTINLAGDESAADDDAIAPAAPSLEEKQLHLKKHQSLEHTVHAPVHRVSLFNSFDRNWEEAVEGSDNFEEILDLGRKCFAALASMFRSCKDASDRSIFGETTIRWWVDDDALTNVDDMAKEEEGHQVIPIAVIRTLWKAVFFDVEENSYSEDDANCIIDSIQHTLVKDLCYLTEIETPSTMCLHLPCDVYAEYGCYILHRFSLQHQVAFWHSRFALKLRQLLLDSSLTDADSMIKRRYAAHSLPRHTAIGSLAVDSQGHFEIDATEDKCTDLRRNLFDNLLCDKGFIKERAKLLGIGNNRPAEPDETLNTDDTNTQIMNIIKHTRDNDWNLLYSTNCHTKDIAWCALFCVPDNKGSPLNEQIKSDNISALTLTSCVDAIVRWAEELLASYHLLQDGGKLTICADTKESNVAFQEKELTKIDHIAQLMSSYEDTRDVKPSSTEEVAKSLLAKEDAWTTKNNSSWLFKDDLSKEPSFIGSLPKGRRRKIIGNPQEEANYTSPLANLLNIEISDLRTTISLGRSLLGLAQFSQFILEIFDKESSSEISRLQLIQCSCLMNAIEVLSCSATILEHILSLDKLDEDDLDESVTTKFGPNSLLQLFAVKREESLPLLSVAGILSADSWFSFGKLVDKTCKVGANDHLMLLCFERALLILNSPKSNALNSRAAEFSSLLSPLTKYKCFLQSNATHSIGVYYYEQGDFDHAAEHLDKSSRLRRQMLDDHCQNCENADRGSLSKLKRNYLVSSTSISEEVFENVFKQSLAHARGYLPKGVFEVHELEQNLSLTLEYLALNQHARQKYQNAISLFQESLILRTVHVGKNSLDVASLHFNMGVVYDDLEHYDSAISQYHESLRIRLNERNKATSLVVMPDLEESVLLTLKCMGRVYETMKDTDNAICCYVKALEMVNTKLRSYRDPADEFDTFGLRLGLAVPVPTIMSDDLNSKSWKSNFQMMNRRELCHFFEPKLAKWRGRSSVSKLKKELVKLHSTVIDLVQKRKQYIWNNEPKSTRSKSPGLSLLLASLSSTFSTGRDAFETALMRSSFCLGRMKLEESRFEEASDHLETALRSQWVLDPASSSDSDSDFSRKSLSRKRQGKSAVDEDDPEEGQLYYSLAICNAAVDDHERAVRCFLTALRYLRRCLRKVDSLEVARVLFDCATSYYYLCNFEQSICFYTECLRILKSVNGEKCSFRRGIVLYCLVIAKAAVDFDSEVSNLLNEAQNLLSGCHDKTILAYMEFMTAVSLHKAASQVPVRMRSKTRISSTGQSLDGGLSWKEMCATCLTMFDQVKNECWFDPSEGVEDPDEVKHLPLSGHICLKKGQVYELIGSVDQALNSFHDAVDYYRIACGDENLFSASVLQHMGMLCSQRTEYHALGYFNEALSIRRNLLGGNDCLVSETLYSSAGLLARFNRYEASMERYHEALRIQMNDSQDSNEVARTLAGMGLCHYNHRAFDLALTCLDGAVKIRKHHVSRLTHSSDDIELYNVEVALAADYFMSGNAHMHLGDYAQAMQFFIQSRDLRWRHVGSGTVEKILDRYFSEETVDEEELLGLAHCLHNIGVVFDIKKEYQRSKPHYEEALAIKNAIAGFSSTVMSIGDQANPDESRALVLHSLTGEDHGYCQINKAALSASVTRQRIAMVYVKLRKYDHALFHFSHALRIQRSVLGKDHFSIGSILSNMGNALCRTSTHPDTAIHCYSESLRISRLRFGQNHTTVASAMFDLGNLYDSTENFTKAMHYYRRALSVYRQKYSQNLTRRLCSGLLRPLDLTIDGGEGTEFLSTGDEIVITSASHPANQIREQYARVTEALRRAKRKDIINRGERIGRIVDSDDAWLTFEALMFRFVEMLSNYVVDPAQTMVNSTINGTRHRIESFAAHAVISAADTLDYQFLLDNM